MESLEARVVAALAERGFRLACAESLTGGLFGARVTRVPGASRAFAGGIIAYHDAAKARLLGVPEDVLAKDGPVSEITARAMAEGARERFGADVAIALTGVAGPEPVGHVPAGIVVVAIASPEGVRARRLHFEGSRAGIREQAVDAALRLVLDELRTVGAVEPD